MKRTRTALPLLICTGLLAGVFAFGPPDAANAPSAGAVVASRTGEPDPPKPPKPKPKRGLVQVSRQGEPDPPMPPPKPKRGFELFA